MNVVTNDCRRFKSDVLDAGSIPAISTCGGLHAVSFSKNVVLHMVRPFRKTE